MMTKSKSVHRSHETKREPGRRHTWWQRHCISKAHSWRSFTAAGFHSDDTALPHYQRLQSLLPEPAFPPARNCALIYVCPQRFRILIKVPRRKKRRSTFYRLCFTFYSFWRSGISSGGLNQDGFVVSKEILLPLPSLLFMDASVMSSFKGVIGSQKRGFITKTEFAMYQNQSIPAFGHADRKPTSGSVWPDSWSYTLRQNLKLNIGTAFPWVRV